MFFDFFFSTFKQTIFVASDWEPEVGVVADDAPKYAAFLRTLASELNGAGLVLNVDVASWTVLYNFSEISTALDSAHNKENRMITMDTYAGKV